MASYSLCAPYAPSATAVAPERPASRTKSDPVRTKEGMILCSVKLGNPRDPNRGRSRVVPVLTEAVSC